MGFGGEEGLRSAARRSGNTPRKQPQHSAANTPALDYTFFLPVFRACCQHLEYKVETVDIESHKLLFGLCAGY